MNSFYLFSYISKTEKNGKRKKKEEKEREREKQGEEEGIFIYRVTPPKPGIVQVEPI